MQTAIKKKDSAQDMVIRPRDASVASFRAFYAWGILNCLLIVALTFFSSVLNNLPNVPRVVYLSIASWLLVSFTTTRASLRLPWVIIFILILQVWLSFTTLFSTFTIGRSDALVGADYVFLIHGMTFIFGASLVYFAPQSRKVFGRILVGICIMSALISYGQFIEVGPLITYGNFIRGANTAIQTETGVIRAAGMFANIGTTVAYSMIGLIMIVSLLKVRKLSPLEIAACFLFASIPFLVQVRNQLPTVAVILLYVCYVAYKRYRMGASILLSLMACACAGIVIAYQEKFGYLLSGGTSTMQYRQEVLWPQAWNAFKAYPWTGIGVESRFVGFFDRSPENLWVHAGVIDNGWLLLMAWGGRIALLLLICILVSALIGSLMACRRKMEDNWERAFVYSIPVIGLYHLTGMTFGHPFVNTTGSMMYFLIAGLAMPSCKSVNEALKRKYHVLNRNRDDDPKPVMEAPITG